MNIAVKDGADHVHFILSNQQFAFFKAVSIRGKATVPFSFTGFLLPSGHRLCPNIFTLYLCHRRKDRNHQLAGIFGTVNAVFHTNQIDAEILHQLQGIQHISGIPAEPGQLEYQHIFHAVFAVLNVLQHPLKFMSALNILAGKAFVRIFTGHYHIFVFSVFPQLVSLSIQTISVHLHGCRYPCVEITFCFSFLHAGRPFLPALNIHPLLSSSPDLHSECSTPTNGVHIPAHGGYPVPILSQSDRESENIYKIPCDSCQCFPAILLFWFCSPFHLPHKAKIHVAYLL